jgi:hypothetical protein
MCSQGDIIKVAQQSALGPPCQVIYLGNRRATRWVSKEVTERGRILRPGAAVGVRRRRARIN